MDTGISIVVVMALLVLALVAWMYVMQRRTRTLRGRFGPEYAREVHRSGRRRAERELERRERRVDRLELRPLPATERSRYAMLWSQEQARFVEDPVAAVGAADQLVEEVLERRGYPMTDFEQRAADLSVDHPRVVENYRAAHAIARRTEHGRAATEELRRAMLLYRALFDELLDDRLASAARN